MIFFSIPIYMLARKSVSLNNLQNIYNLMQEI